jgi:hypothetical protein
MPNALVLMWVGVLALIVLERFQYNRRRADSKLDALHRRVDAIAEHLGIAPDQSCPAEVSDPAKAGRKMDAIKAYRKATGASLAEAKEFVEALPGV